MSGSSSRIIGGTARAEDVLNSESPKCDCVPKNFRRVCWAFLSLFTVLSGQREYIRAAMPVLEGAQLFEAVAFSACVLSGCGGYYAYDHICHDDESPPPPPQGTPWDRQKPPSVDATTAQEAE